MNTENNTPKPNTVMRVWPETKAAIDAIAEHHQVSLVRAGQMVIDHYLDTHPDLSFVREAQAKAAQASAGPSAAA
jgi:hypothetical protein